MAKARNVSPQIMIQEVVLDELLDRIAHSKYQSHLVLKGGFLIASLLGTDTRATRDIDTSVVGLPVSKEKVEIVFQEICRTQLPDELMQLSVTKIEDIRKNAEYAGYRIHIQARIYSSTVDAKVDISTGDAITERAISYSHKLLLENRKIQIMAYNIETIIAEKLETVVDRSSLNTRLKDFYDIYLFNKKYVTEIDYHLLNKAIYATAAQRGTLNNIGSYVGTLTQLKANESMKKLWQVYQSKNSYTQNIEFEHTCDAAIKIIQNAGIQ